MNVFENSGHNYNSEETAPDVSATKNMEKKKK